MEILQYPVFYWMQAWPKSGQMKARKSMMWSTEWTYVFVTVCVTVFRYARYEPYDLVCDAIYYHKNDESWIIVALVIVNTLL